MDPFMVQPLFHIPPFRLHQMDTVSAMHVVQKKSIGTTSLNNSRFTLRVIWEHLRYNPSSSMHFSWVSDNRVFNACCKESTRALCKFSSSCAWRMRSGFTYGTVCNRIIGVISVVKWMRLRRSCRRMALKLKMGPSVIQSPITIKFHENQWNSFRDMRLAKEIYTARPGRRTKLLELF